MRRNLRQAIKSSQLLYAKFAEITETIWLVDSYVYTITPHGEAALCLYH